MQGKYAQAVLRPNSVYHIIKRLTRGNLHFLKNIVQETELYDEIDMFYHNFFNIIKESEKILSFYAPLWYDNSNRLEKENRL